MKFNSNEFSESGETIEVLTTTDDMDQDQFQGDDGSDGYVIQVRFLLGPQWQILFFIDWKP